MAMTAWKCVAVRLGSAAGMGVAGPVPSGTFSVKRGFLPVTAGIAGRHWAKSTELTVGTASAFIPRSRRPQFQTCRSQAASVGFSELNSVVS